MIVSEKMELMFDIAYVIYPVGSELTIKEYKAFRLSLFAEYEEEETKTLKDILDICKGAGYRGGCIHVIAENALDGKVFVFGNNYEYTDGKMDLTKPLWEEVGKTQGYA